MSVCYVYWQNFWQILVSNLFREIVAIHYRIRRQEICFDEKITWLGNMIWRLISNFPTAKITLFLIRKIKPKCNSKESDRSNWISWYAILRWISFLNSLHFFMKGKCLISSFLFWQMSFRFEFSNRFCDLPSLLCSHSDVSDWDPEAIMSTNCQQCWIYFEIQLKIHRFSDFRHLPFVIVSKLEFQSQIEKKSNSLSVNIKMIFFSWNQLIHNKRTSW